MILVTGAGGQLGNDLVAELARREGADRIIATDIRVEPDGPLARTGVRTGILDVRDAGAVADLVRSNEVRTVFHLAGILSASGERKPDVCWGVNVEGLRNVLDLARDGSLRVFWPSSIAVFGPDTPRMDTPQATIQMPTTMYGVTKVTGELLCSYYARRWSVDVRSVRYPGIVSWTVPPGGGTTDFAPEMFFAAVRGGRYTCFVGPDTRLPMMYMPDAVNAALDIMDAEPGRLTVRTSYNITAFSFSAAELAATVAERVPGFSVAYAPDERQAIADSWPSVIDDSRARAEWGWKPAYDLGGMTDDMLRNLRKHGVPETVT
jgi:nucleoside-diphosphate-sugar epimerase